MEPRPSVFKRAWAMLWEQPAAYVVVVILPYVVILGLGILIGRLAVRIHPPHVDPLTLWASMGWGTRLLTIVAMMASATVPSYVAARGVCRLALEQEKDVSISLGAVLWDMLRFVPAAALYFLLLGIPSFLGSFILIVPGLLIAAACGLIIPAGIDDRLGPFAAVRRGLSLVKRVYGRVFGLYASYLALMIVGRVVLATFTSMAGDESSVYSLFILSGLWVAGVLLAMAPVYIMVTLLYCEARDMDAALPAAAQVSAGHGTL